MVLGSCLEELGYLLVLLVALEGLLGALLGVLLDVVLADVALILAAVESELVCAVGTLGDDFSWLG